MAHQYLPKIFHSPCKNPLPPPIYSMYGPLLCLKSINCEFTLSLNEEKTGKLLI